MKKFLLLCLLLSSASFVDGEEVALSTESRIVLQAALAEFDLKNYDGGLSMLKELEKKTPDDPFVLNLIGAAYTKKKDFAAARPYFDHALAKVPNFFPAQFNLGELIFLERRYPEALEFFRQLLKANPNSELLQFKVFLCELQIGNTKGAEKAMNEIRYPPDTPAWYFARAIWEEKKGNHQKARELVAGARFIFGLKTTMFDDAFQDVGLDLR